jgi:hypothetical protein
MIHISAFSCRRFAKIRLDDHAFLGNWLQVSYAPQFERFLDTKEKSEVRRNEVHGQIRSNKMYGLTIFHKIYASYNLLL